MEVTMFSPFPSIHCHQLCIKFSTGLKKNKNTLPKGESARTRTGLSLPPDVEIVREVKRCRKLTCVYCKRKGASVTCNGEVGNCLPVAL